MPKENGGASVCVLCGRGWPGGIDDAARCHYIKKKENSIEESALKNPSSQIRYRGRSIRLNFILSMGPVLAINKSYLLLQCGHSALS